MRICTAGTTFARRIHSSVKIYFSIYSLFSLAQTGFPKYTDNIRKEAYVMNIKKMLTAVTASMLIASLIVMPVSAHGHHGRNRTASTTVTTQYAVCTVEDCTETGHHAHDGEVYCSYDHDNGYCDGTCGYCDGSCGYCGTTTTSTGSHHGRGHHGCR